MKILRLLAALLLASCILPFASARAQSPIRIIFLHHSCGENLIDQGGVREGLTALGYEFYDHGYNGDGLRLADGSYTGTNYDVPDDNTDPDGLAAIFAQPLHDPPDNTFSHLMEYDVIAVKSCFPTSNIGSDEQLAEFQSYYLSMRARVDGYPEKLFIIVTQPPQVPGASDPQEATRARVLADWLASDEFLGGHSNVVTFNFFGHLAGADDFLRPEYRVDDTDAHPNEGANQTIGPLFVDFIDQAIQSYLGQGPRPEPIEEPQPGDQPAEEQPSAIAPPAAVGVLDDFEGEFVWRADGDGESAVECGPDSAAHAGVAALRLAYGVEPGGWIGCGRYYDAPQDWSGATGLALWLRADVAGQWVTLNLFSGSAEAVTPFVVDLEVPVEWMQVVVPWTDFARADWADPGGLAELDPARVMSLSFTVGAQESRNEGALWVDDVVLVAAGGEEQPASTAAPPPEAPVEEQAEQEEGEPGGGLCSGAALLPLAALGVLAAIRRRR
jgi:MYXO-CTERM domain-containing protein